MSQRSKEAEHPTVGSFAAAATLALWPRSNAKTSKQRGFLFFWHDILLPRLPAIKRLSSVNLGDSKNVVWVLGLSGLCTFSRMRTSSISSSSNTAEQKWGKCQGCLWAKNWTLLSLQKIFDKKETWKQLAHVVGGESCHSSYLCNTIGNPHSLQWTSVLKRLARSIHPGCAHLHRTKVTSIWEPDLNNAA